MDRIKYLRIRKTQDLSMKPLALPLHYLKEAVFLGLITLLWNSDHFVKFAVVPLIACVMFRNFSLMHEAVHKAVSKHSLVNDLVGIFAGAICFLPFEPWRRSHLEHHSWSGNVDKDPVTAIITAFPKFHPALKLTLSFFWRAWFPMLAFMQYIVFWYLASKIFLRHRNSIKLLISLIAPVTVWATVVAMTSTAFALSALLPGLIFYMIGVEVVNFPHHLQLPQYHGETRFPVWEQYKIARSCIYPKWFARWVALNFNYHIEHHMFPDVPWYRLEALHSVVLPELGEAYNTDPYLKWFLENKQKSIGDVIKAADQSTELANQAA